MAGIARPGNARQGEYGAAGLARLGAQWQVLAGEAGRVLASLCMAGMARLGSAWRGEVRLAWPVLVRRGTVRQARHVLARFVLAWWGTAGEVWLGSARLRVARQAGRCMAWLYPARRGSAGVDWQGACGSVWTGRQGEAWLVFAWQAMQPMVALF